MKLSIIQFLVSVALLSASSHGALAARNGDKTLGWPGLTLTGSKCKGGLQGFGPFDYTDSTYTVDGGYTRHGRNEAPIKTVEKVHFTSVVEQLISGRTTTDPMGDIDYTIRAFPNHHRALYAMVRYYLRSIPIKHQKTSHTKYSPSMTGGYPPPECYFQRAVTFAAEDGMVRVLYGLYLHRRNDLDGAMDQYKEAEKMVGPNAEYFYNRGLLHFDRGEFAEARKYSNMAEKLNYRLPGLRKKLDEVEKSQAAS